MLSQPSPWERRWSCLGVQIEVEEKVQ